LGIGSRVEIPSLSYLSNVLQNWGLARLEKPRPLLGSLSKEATLQHARQVVLAVARHLAGYGRQRHEGMSHAAHLFEVKPAKANDRERTTEASAKLEGLGVGA